jgi:hypothetical protein
MLSHVCIGSGLWLAGDCWSGRGWQSPTSCHRPLPRRSPIFAILCPFLPPSCPQFFLYMVNSSSLTLAHARLAQTSPKNFKHP